MECEEFILPDWSPPDNPIQSERASSSLMECEKFILPDWSPSDDPARVLAAEGRRNPSNHNDDMLMIMIMIIGNLPTPHRDFSANILLRMFAYLYNQLLIIINHDT